MDAARGLEADMRMKWAGALVAALVLLAGPAWADLQTQGDANDVGGALDIKEVALNHNADAVVVTFRTYDQFGPATLHSNVFVLYLKRQGSQIPWYYLEIRHNNGAYRARLVPCNDDACKYKAGTLVPVGRPDDKSIRVRIPRTLISKAGTTLRWNSVAGDGNYIDRAPNSGVLIHDVGAAG